MSGWSSRWNRMPHYIDPSVTHSCGLKTKCLSMLKTSLILVITQIWKLCFSASTSLMDCRLPRSFPGLNQSHIFTSFATYKAGESLIDNFMWRTSFAGKEEVWVNSSDSQEPQAEAAMNKADTVHLCDNISCLTLQHVWGLMHEKLPHCCCWLYESKFTLVCCIYIYCTNSYQLSLSWEIEIIF